jgi:predicted peroxiredoxin
LLASRNIVDRAGAPQGRWSKAMLSSFMDCLSSRTNLGAEACEPLADLTRSFVEAGGEIYVCSPCVKKCNLDEDRLVAGAVIVGGAKLVEFMGEASPSN